MKLILHIGFPKTGTSSIQTFLFENTELLKKNRILYLATDERVEYRNLAVIAMNEKRSDAYTRHLLSQTQFSREDLVADLTKQITLDFKSINKEDYDAVIISSEHLSSRLKRLEEVERLKSILEPYFDDVNVVAYIREQAERIPSQYSTHIKSGGTLKFDKFVHRCHESVGMFYDKTLKNWVKVFGKDRTLVRIFDKREFIGGDLFQDFIQANGFSFVQGFHYPSSQVNQSISKFACKLMLIFNKYFPDSIKLNPSKRQTVVDFLCRHNGLENKLNSEEKEFVRKVFSESNNSIKCAFFPERSELFMDKNK